MEKDLDMLAPACQDEGPDGYAGKRKRSRRPAPEERMRVTVRCLASLSRLQPDPPHLDVPEGAVLAEVYARLGLAPDADVVAILDGGPANPRTSLKDGSLIELVPMVEGG